MENLALDGLDTVTQAESGVPMTVLKADGSGDPVLMVGGKALVLTLLGSDSKRYRQAVRQTTDRRLARAQQSRNRRLSGAEELDIADQETLDLIVACTVGWNLVDRENNNVAFNDANVRDFYRRFPAARDQADSFIGSRANFLALSGPSSSSSPASTSAQASQ